MIFDNVCAVLFDLDGTLVDTAPDIAFALNTLLKEQGKNPLPYQTIRPVVSHGAKALLALAMNVLPEHADYEAKRQRLLDIYQQNIARKSRLFAGMEEVILTLEQRAISWGVITNKPAFLTEPLLAKLNLSHRAACIVSADTTPFTKPHPAPMIHACKLIDKKPEQCVYIGDTKRDIEAGNRVNMYTVVALYGYLAKTDEPNSWQADAAIDHPRDILTWL